MVARRAVFFVPHGLVVVFLLSRRVAAHARWKCPAPRSPDTGIKTGPCGSDTDDFSSLPIEVAPGPFRVMFEESVYHTGAPFRISLSDDGSDGGACVLVDHVPHNDNPASGRPTFRDESTYVPYSLTIDIPDVRCERCSLHLSNPMTDKIGGAGSPDGNGCTDPGSCFSVYHSCTISLRISGSEPRSEYQCADPLPSDWPRTWTGDGGAVVDASVPNLYRRESSTWGGEGNGLLTVPERYRLDAGGVCGTSPNEVTDQDETAQNDLGDTTSPASGGSAAVLSQVPSKPPTMDADSDNGTDENSISPSSSPINFGLYFGSDGPTSGPSPKSSSNERSSTILVLLLISINALFFH